MNRLTWDCREIWSAAYLQAMGVPLVGVYRSPEGKVRWRFANHDNRALRTHRQWRHEADAWVSGPALARAYRIVARASHDTRSPYGDSTDDQDRAR